MCGESNMASAPSRIKSDEEPEHQLPRAKEPQNERIRSPSFVVKMTKSSFLSMTVPSFFVENQGHLLKEAVILGFNGAKPTWIVRVKIKFWKKYVHVAFGAGWKNFAKFYGIVEGDFIKFELVRMCQFNVTRAA